MVQFLRKIVTAAPGIATLDPPNTDLIKPEKERQILKNSSTPKTLVLFAYEE